MTHFKFAKRRLAHIVPLMLLLTLACGFVEASNEADAIVISRRLPTLTPTFTVTSESTVIAPESTVIQQPVEPASNIELPASPTPLFTATPKTIPTSNPTLNNDASSEENLPSPTPAIVDGGSVTAIPPFETGGWSFLNLWPYTDPNENHWRLSGEMINNTGMAQEMGYVTGTFYDVQGQVIADETSVIDRWPLDVVPAGARVPFELTINGIQGAVDFSLRVVSDASDEPPRQDFEFLAVNSTNQAEEYCLSGQLQNLGNDLDEYLIIVLVIFNQEERVISSSAYYESDAPYIVDDELSTFEICTQSYNQPINRYDLRAWGY